MLEISSINPYREYIKLINDGVLDPEKIDIDVLIEEFKSRIEGLDNRNLYLQSAKFVEAVGKLLKIKTESVFKVLYPEVDKEKQEEKKIYTKKEIEEVLIEYDIIENEELKEIFSSYRRKVGRKKGSKIPIMKYEDFKELVKEEVSETLFENTDYNSYALKVLQEIEKGKFKIKSYKDFIGLMFAITIFDLDISGIKDFI